MHTGSARLAERLGSAPPQCTAEQPGYQGSRRRRTAVASSAMICCWRIQYARAPCMPSYATLTASSGRPERYKLSGRDEGQTCRLSTRRRHSASGYAVGLPSNDMISLYGRDRGWPGTQESNATALWPVIGRAVTQTRTEKSCYSARRAAQSARPAAAGQTSARTELVHSRLVGGVGLAPLDLNLRAPNDTI